MALDIWKKCHGEDNIQVVNDTAWRIVEAQEITATRKLVDSYEEYKVLENLIASQKPALGLDNLKYHPLLYTPFRYPPLKHGSRFGNRFEPSLWYGSLNVDSALSEKAFYQLNFLRGSRGDFGIVESQLTLFSCEIRSKRGIRLELSPFLNYVSEISSPISYSVSQQLGSRMRASLVETVTYQSARDINKGLNIGLFTPKAFLHLKPNSLSFQTWQCISNKEVVEFTKASAIVNESKIFPIQNFLIDNELPFPSA
jgi:hypothetical protein